MAYAGTNVNKDSKITAAVASNIWGAYEKNGKMAFNNEGLKFMFMDCDVSTVFIFFFLKASLNTKSWSSINVQASFLNPGVYIYININKLNVYLSEIPEFFRMER